MSNGHHRPEQQINHIPQESKRMIAMQDSMTDTHTTTPTVQEQKSAEIESVLQQFSTFRLLYTQ